VARLSTSSPASRCTKVIRTGLRPESDAISRCFPQRTTSMLGIAEESCVNTRYRLRDDGHHNKIVIAGEGAARRPVLSKQAARQVSIPRTDHENRAMEWSRISAYDTGRLYYGGRRRRCCCRAARRTRLGVDAKKKKGGARSGRSTGRVRVRLPHESEVY